MAYADRLITNRLIYDIERSEIYELLFGKELSSDEVRKRIYGISEFIEKIKEEDFENISDSEMLRQIEEQKLELEKEKVKFQDQRREYKKLVRSMARDEHIIESVKETAELLNNTQPFRLIPIPQTSSNKHGVLLLSDWHSDLEVDNFLNTFNKTEFLRRINKLVNKVIEHGKLHNINTLHVFNLGDLYSGIIMNIIRIQTNEDIVSQTMYIAELLAEILYEFSRHFPNIRYYNVIDNHSRVIANKNESLNKENFSRFIPWYLKTRLKDIVNIEIVDNALDDEIAVVDICGFTCFAVHGHLDRIGNVVQNLSMMIKKIPDYVFMGHYHRNASDEIHSCDVIVNSSLIGVDDHSKNIRKTSKPAQKFMIFAENEGMECMYPILLI